MKKTSRINSGFVTIILFSIFALTACGDTEDVQQEADATSEEAYDNLIVSHFQPGNHPLQTEVLDGLNEDLEEQTDGRISMEFYPSNQIGDADSQYDMAVTGEADVSLSVSGYSAGRFPLVTVMELPFMSESAEHASEILNTLYEEFPEIQEEHHDTNPLFLFSAEPAQIMSRDHRIENPEDMEGLRVRSPSPLGNELIESLGATPISMPMGEVYEGIDRGVIDAAMVPFETLYNYSFYEVVNYVTVGDFAAQPFFSVMNTETYENFSDSDQEIIDDLTGTELAKEAGSVYDADGEVGVEMAKEDGVEFIELEGDAMSPWEEALSPAVQEWIEEREEEGYPAQEIYDRARELEEELS
ncbi:TRAP transporter substrate-binding protein [Salicibibacter kimchii]|uniref:TRAP transporter substrate-binding protein n=1 Tax=Salicibibacter kimchii TaxID=2099786 RepID=A0A345C1F4_9BACI|nr:TRAP transporter substrate-binding protein [Salicibibacter kimchii]AXF57035.1 hypothetical protein DT065_14185 [Salicibibacter kimchii]